MVLHRLTRSRYFHFIILNMFLISGYWCSGTHITITRINSSLDVFTTPQTNCNAFCSAKKSLVLRNTSSSCACRCDFSASTFFFKGDLTTSVCVDNIKIQSTLGQCQVLLDNNTITSPLPVLDLSIPGTRVLTGPVNGSSTCSVFQEEFLVNGTWVAGAGRNLTTFTTDKNLLKWSSISSRSPYAGRVVRVHLHCDAKKFCVLIKIQGRISYNVSTPVIPTSVILHPSPTTSFIKPVYPTLSINHGTSGLQFTSSKTENLIPLKPATISPTLATVAMVTSSAVVIGGTKAVQDGCERGTWVFCQWFYLGIAVLGTVVLLVLVIISISCACIRRKRRSLRHQKPVFFKAEIKHLEETDSSTELALIEDAKPKNEDAKGQNTEEAFYQNVPRREQDKNQLYRPLRSSDSTDSPTAPTSPGRLSYASSTNKVTIYDDNTDSNQLIKSETASQSSPPAGKRLRTFCPSPVVHAKKGFLLNQAVLDTEEEATYEIMETKTLPHSRKINRASNESITGFENRVFEEDDHRQSHYEVVSDEQPDYENLEGDYQEEQLNYETMQEQRKEGKDYLGEDEEQENYETMDSFSGEQPRNYETIKQGEKHGAQESYLLYEKMGSHDKNCDPDNEDENEKMGNERQYNIPDMMTEDEHDDSHYDIPELDLRFQQEQDDPDYHYAVNTSGQNKITGLTVLMDLKYDGGDDDDDDGYVYSNVPEIQANNLREKLRNSWQSGGQRQGEETSRGNKMVDDKPETEKRPSSWNANVAGKKTGHDEDSEELYSLPDDLPKPLPSCLLKASSSSQLKEAQDKNQASPKQKQRMEQKKLKDIAGVSSRAPLGNPKTSSDAKHNGKSSHEQTQNSKVGKQSKTGREIKKDRLEHSDREGKTTAMKNKQISMNKPVKSKGGTSSSKHPRSPSSEKQERGRRQPTSGNIKASVEPRKHEEYHQNNRWNQNGNQNQTLTENDDHFEQGKHSEGPIIEQPLYTNLVEMKNQRQTLANEKTDVQTNQDLIDQQPLYENVGSMVSHVG